MSLLFELAIEVSEQYPFNKDSLGKIEQNPWVKNQWPLVYFIQNEDTIGLLAVNYDRNESAMNLKNSDEIVDELENGGIKNIKFNTVKDGQSISEIQIDKPIEYWRSFLILGLLFVLTEMALIKFWK